MALTLTQKTLRDTYKVSFHSHMAIPQKHMRLSLVMVIKISLNELYQHLGQNKCLSNYYVSLLTKNYTEL
jgi:hypothetical protein